MNIHAAIPALLDYARIERGVTARQVEEMIARGLIAREVEAVLYHFAFGDYA